MDRSDVMYLVSETQSKDMYGAYTSLATKRKVYCEVSSITQSEWFEGSRNGLNPSLRFRMFAPDYEGEKLILYNDTFYSIYRTYRDKNEIIELYCEVNEKAIGTVVFDPIPPVVTPISSNG